MSANRLCESRAPWTPSSTSSWLVTLSLRICSAASMTAQSSGTAISASPASIRPLSDFGLGQRIGRSGSYLPGITLQTLFPIQRGAHDGVDIVEPRRPAEHLAHPVTFGHERRPVAGAPGFLADVEADAGDFLD